MMWHTPGHGDGTAQCPQGEGPTLVTWPQARPQGGSAVQPTPGLRAERALFPQGK